MPGLASEALRSLQRVARGVERFVLPTPALETLVEPADLLPELSGHDYAAGDAALFTSRDPAPPIPPEAVQDLLRTALIQHAALGEREHEAPRPPRQLDPGANCIGIEHHV